MGPTYLPRTFDASNPLVAVATTDADIARFNQFNHVGGLLGAVLTGALGDWSLRWGFTGPMVLVLALLPLAGTFAVRPA